MKKVKTLLILGILFACQQQKVEGPNSEVDYQEVINHFNGMLTTTLHHIKSEQLVSVIEETNEYSVVKINSETIQSSVHDFLSVNYFEGAQYDYENMDLEEILNFPEPGLRTSEIVTSIFELTDAFSANQKDLLIPFSSAISELPDLAAGEAIINEFNTAIISSTVLSEEEKIQLLEFSSSAYSLVHFMSDGGFDEIRASILEELEGVGSGEDNGRIMGCSIDWRSVWGGAVVGLAAGAIKGGIVGATTGTFTVPVLGTAVGGVGGAVFGGAVGYVSGATAAIAANLLLTCGRPDRKGTQVPDNQDQELDGKTKASCDRMAELGLSLPSVCYQYYNFQY